MQHVLQWCIQTLWAYLGTSIKRELLRLFFYLALLIYTIFWSPNPVDCYVLKSKCSVLMQMAYEYCGILKSWLKPLLNKLEDQVYSMKTHNHQKRKRFHSQRFQQHTSKFTFTFHHKKKKCNLVQIICTMRSESNNMQAMQVHFDMDSKLV